MGSSGMRYLLRVQSLWVGARVTLPGARALASKLEHSHGRRVGADQWVPLHVHLATGLLESPLNMAAGLSQSKQSKDQSRSCNACCDMAWEGTRCYFCSILLVTQFFPDSV